MDFGSYLPPLLPLPAVPLVLLAARRLHPAAATVLTAAASAVLTIGAAVSLGLFTVAGLAGLSIVADSGNSDITDVPVDATAAALLLAGLTAGTVAATRRVRAIRAANDLAGPSPLVIVRTDSPIAHALPGRPGTIVVSTGMLAGLTPAERRALLAHEQAHLRRSHHLFVAVVDVLAAANPLLRPLRKVVRYTIERWADELAARAVGSRAVVARAVGKAALATKNHAPTPDPVLLAAAAGEVPRRVAALLIAPPARRLRLILTSSTGVFALIAIGLTVASAACAVEAAGDLHQILTLAAGSPVSTR
jgi:Zn-dependent protease with chaperone function